MTKDQSINTKEIKKEEENSTEKHQVEKNNKEKDEKKKDLSPEEKILEQEEKLDAKKRERESFGSVNLRAVIETVDLQKSIKKMEGDREDLVSAIIKLRSSINELNQKGRERLLEAFEKVNRIFNEVYDK